MRDPSREVVVTGAGVCCRTGDDLAQIERDLRQGHSPPFPLWDVAVEYQSRNQVVGRYPGALTLAELGIEKNQSRFMGRAAMMAMFATRRALAQSGLARRDIGVLVSSGTGDVQTHRDLHDKLAETKSVRRVAPTLIPRLMSSTVSANLSFALETTGPSFTATAACAGGAYNILLAAELIEHGHIDAAIAGGVEVADLHFHAGFDAMRAYNAQDNDNPVRPSRPYAADRAGFIFSEAAGVVTLETRAAAAARSAPILGVLRGYGMSSDGAGEMVAPSPSGSEACMRRALVHAGVDAEAIDYINTHGTSTPLGDVSEVRAIRKVFGPRHVAYSSTKGYTGHSITAAGAIEMIFTLAMLRGGWIAPSVFADPLDPELADYPPVMVPTDRPIKLALSNSFGFGGTNATLVLGAP